MKVAIISTFDTFFDRVDLLKEYYQSKDADVTVITSDYSHRLKEKYRNEKADVQIPVREYKKNLSVDRLRSHDEFAKKTKAYLAEHCKKEYTVYEADEDAVYDEVIEIDLSKVRPTVAFPHLPGNAKTIDEVEAMEPIKIDQVVIGSCTNGRMEDLRKAAAILKGHTVHPDVRVMVIPATQKIYKECIKEGLLDIFVDAGCAVNTPSCGPCMGRHMGVMAAGEKCVSTTNRNFVGRMGHVDSLIYLASPEVAAASAIAGCIANPEKVGEK